MSTVNDITIVCRGFPLTSAISQACLDNWHQAITGFEPLGERLGHAKITLVQENSPLKAGRDVYIAKITIPSLELHHNGLRHENLYAVIEMAFDRLREELRRHSDRSKPVRAKKARQLAAAS